MFVAENRKARFNFELLQKFEAGIVLQGSEVKSIRLGQSSIKEAYVALKEGEVFLQNMHVSPYTHSAHNNHEPLRLRKLLLHKSEALKIHNALTQKGLSCVPTKLYFKRGRLKVEIYLARGKKRHDKRQALKEKALRLER